MKTLGIFIGSDRFPEYFRDLAAAAGDRGLKVHLHFFETGVRLVPEIEIDRLPATSKITICSESAVRQQLDAGANVPWRSWLVPADRMARIIRACDRHVFI
jgi:hypothetical protein